MSTSSDSKDQEYKSIKATTPTPTAVVKSKEQPGWLKRKYIKIKKAAADFWVVGRYGFQLGGLAGIILGFFVGGFESIRMKSLWPLPLAMLGSGFTFGCIFAISTVIRSQDNLNYKYTNNSLQIVYYDQESGKYMRRNISLTDKDSFYNRNI
jgi:hypothetical protein